MLSGQYFFAKFLQLPFYKEVPFMKKMWILFVFPAVFLCFMVFVKGSAVHTARFAIWAMNPVSTIKYHLSDRADSLAATIISTENDGQKPDRLAFEQFTATTPQPGESPSATYDGDHPIVAMTYAPVLNDVTYRRQNCYVKNVTRLSKGEVEAELLGTLDIKVEKNSDQPQILIMHTHATESYQNYPELFYDPEYTCRTTDNSKNMVSVGKIMADKLNELGYNTLQDATLHDYPNYNGSYDRSKATVEAYLAKYPSIKIVLDVHRDAIERADGTRIKPVASINGTACAQVMLISGADNGYLNMPNYKKNLRFASHLQNSMESLYPGLTRPILFDYRNYNQQLTTGSILIEVGGHANTLEEAHNSARFIAYSLADMLDKQL